MCVQVFGNSPSPAIATYGLRKSVEHSDSDVTKFVAHDFYVDDALTSLPTPTEAISLLKRTRNDLQEHGLYIHKIASNSDEVMLAFPSDDLAKGLMGIDLQNEALPVQRSLGLQWDLNNDTFVSTFSSEGKPFTRRGVLSMINSIFDPVGFLSPVTIQGRLIMRDLTTNAKGWDEPLPDTQLANWRSWVDTLPDLKKVHIPRTYSEEGFTHGTSSVHIFSDASEQAIAAVAYILTYEAGLAQIGFLMGKSKVAPISGHTIPRLELCAAVIAVKIAQTVAEHMEMLIETFTFHTDSRVVLGYINNNTRRFHTFVSNRVERIRHFTKPAQWRYICTRLNPADCATHGVTASDLTKSA
ncbi:uncharacterized protein LOC128219515 [Mya arenaria]|uniref:uncharacterized protein LOC128219515 n=1 Tax=Mya arenaria TaxID=6604 RepID=UPI0022E88681|nr:uncharacterized protein LOC128219515 [Mya arenaria]